MRHRRLVSSFNEHCLREQAAQYLSAVSDEMSAAALQEGGEGTEAEVSRPRWPRSGEIRGDSGRFGEIWGDLRRSGEIWGDLGRWTAPEMGVRVLAFRPALERTRTPLHSAIQEPF